LQPTPPPRPTFGFVVHPLKPAQARLLGVRSADLPLALRGTSSRGARPISRLQVCLPNGQRIDGLLTAVPQTTDMLLADQAAGVEAVIGAVEACRAAGATVVGLGAVAAVIGGQGKAVARATEGCAITTGNTLTSVAAADTYQALSRQLGRAGPVALMGPPGPVANAILHQLVARGLSVEIVTPKPPKPLQRIADTLNARQYGAVRFIPDATEALRAGRILIAASSTGGRLKLSALPANSVVIDVAAPQDVEIDGRRDDVLLVDGEYVRLPAPLGGSTWQHVYRWVTRQSQHVFACFAEPMILAAAGRPDLANVGRTVPPERLAELARLMHEAGMGIDRLHEHGRPLSTRRLARFKIQP
jgi:predicted amino acid dehydrogenase